VQQNIHKGKAMKRLGIINSWNPGKAVGTILVRDVNPPERFFLFSSRVISGPEPSLNACVLFEVDVTRPVLSGKLPVAIRVEVLDGAQ
jgi:hypothetical protein